MDATWIRRIWERKGPFSYALCLLLLPASFFYRLAIQIRNLLYSLKWLPVKKLPRPVISVGNLTVGGTGKTPTTLWLSRELTTLGYRVAILSRGYKRGDKEEPLLLGIGANSSEGEESAAAGDEPTMMARVFGQKVGIGKNRYEVGMNLLRETEADVFLLDDGFQHRRLGRDVDLLLLGSDWRGWVLPAGPFREPRSALRRADLYLATGAREKWEKLLAGRPGETLFFGSLQPTGLLAFEGGQWKECPLSILYRSKVLAVSAVANPSPLYRMIHDWDGEIVDTLEFPDHHNYTLGDWQKINRAARNSDLIVTTEKDMVKLVRFPFAREKLLALRVEMTVENGAALVQAIEARIRAGKEEA